MRIKIIGDNNCARATRHLLRMAGFAVTDFLPVEAVIGAPLSGYAITIDLAPAPYSLNHSLKPDQPTHGQFPSPNEEALLLQGGASSPSSFADEGGRGEAGGGTRLGDGARHGDIAGRGGRQAEACPTLGHIHFDSVDGALEAAVLRHVSQLAKAAVMVDRPGGVVHSDRELRIVVPCTYPANKDDAKMDEAAAVAVEFGVLRGLLDLTSPRAKATLFAPGGDDGGGSSGRKGRQAEACPTGGGRSARGGRKKWWAFGLALLAGAGLAFAPQAKAAPRRAAVKLSRAAAARGSEGAAMHLEAALAAAEPQGQFATGQGVKIFDGANTMVVDPCKAQVKQYASINQTASTQLVAGTASKKIYICSIHVVVAAATNVALVEGTGTVCASGTAGVSGFGGATAATGWNFMANGGIALGNGDSSLGAESVSADDLCLLSSGSGQVSGGISYVVQ